MAADEGKSGDGGFGGGFPDPNEPWDADPPADAERIELDDLASAAAGDTDSGSSPRQQVYPVAPHQTAPPQYVSPVGPHAGYYGAAAPKSNGMAVTSLVLGIISFVMCGPFLSIPAVICGHTAKRQLRENPQETGDGMATAGLVLGYINIGLVVLVLLVYVLMFVIFGLAAAGAAAAGP